MSVPSDHRLMAYHDGALSPEEQRAVEAALDADPGARERLRILAQTDALVRRAFAAPMQDAVPERLLSAIEAAATPDAASNVVRLRRGPSASAQRWALALAASVALVVGVAGGFGVSRLLPGQDVAGGEVSGSVFLAAFDGQLQTALETVPSGQRITWRVPDHPDEAAMTPVLTFEDGSGRFCREYQASAPAPDGPRAVLGIACRSTAGQWRAELVAASKTQPSGTFTPASGSASAAVDAAIDELMADGPLSAERERQLLDRAWRRP